jgi:hypothetical protein
MSGIVKLNNWWVRRRGVKARPEQILLLLPHCLHRQGCPCNVLHSLDACRRCGQCSMGDLARLREELGVVGCVVGGGRQALEHARRPEVKAVVAVACDKELRHGIFASFPKPVLAIPNRTPEGPCRNTLADPAQVVAAIRLFL